MSNLVKFSNLILNYFFQIGGPLKIGGPRQMPSLPSAKAGPVWQTSVIKQECYFFECNETSRHAYAGD